MGVSIAIGAAIGAGIGAVGTYASGGRGDALWKGALTGAVSGAVTAGVGSWAGAAAGGWAGAAGGALAGGAGGVTAGVLGTALNGGNGSDYLKRGLFGGLTGAAIGGAGGYFGGGNALPADAEGIPTTADGGYAFDDAVAGSTVDPNTASSLSGGTVGSTGGTAAIDPTVATPTPATTAPTLADITSGSFAGTGSATPTTTEFSGVNIGEGVIPQTPQNVGAGSFGAGSVPVSGNLDFSGVPIGEGQIPTDAGVFAETPTTTDKGFFERYLPNGAPENPSTAENLWGKISQKMAGYPSPNTGANKMGEFGLKDYLKMQGYGSLMSGGVKTMGALATRGETAANRQQLMDLYNQQNQQNQYYADKMQQTYDDPNAYLNSPEALATRQQAMQKLLAQNAQAGRRTAGLPMQNQLMQNQLMNLANYRRGMVQPNYSAAGNLYNTAASYSPTGDITTGLASMFTPLSAYALYSGM